MSKHKYTQEQNDFVFNLVSDGFSTTAAAQKMCAEFNIPYKESIGRGFRKKLQRKGLSTEPTIEDTDIFKEAQNKQHRGDKKRFLISWCQSETKVHEKFLNNMEAYAEYIDAEILICAGRYKNPTSLSSNKRIKDSEKNVKNTWDKRVLPYLDANRHNLHKHLQLLSDVKIQPTAATPLSGMNSITGLESCIIGHPRMHFTSLPIADCYPHKILLTTGACSIENYTDTKAGKKGGFNHVIGCVIVELDGNDFHVRQICADKRGDFYDLSFCATNGIISQCGDGIPAMIFGDAHLQHHNETALNVSLDIARKLKAEVVFLHDIIDAFSVSHHERKNPFILLDREEDGSWSLEKEIDYMVDWCNTNSDLNFVSVYSNHNDFIDRWLINEDWRKTSNKKLFLEFANVMAKKEAPKGIVNYVLSERTKNVQGLALDESYNVLGFECGSHGHIGVSGGRSSVVQLKNLPMKTVTGHTHTPRREDGHLCVGTLTNLRVGYNKGFSSWLHSNVVIYPNGKASHINIINGKYTTLL